MNTRVLLSLVLCTLCATARAAITVTALTTGNDVTIDTTAATASVSPTSNCLVIVDLWNGASSTVNFGPPSSVAGAGLTFTQVITVGDSGTGGNFSRWRALSASPSTGAISITYAQDMVASRWSVYEACGIDTGGTNGSSAIVQSAQNSDVGGTVNTITATLAAFGAADNGAISAHAWFNAAGAAPTATPDTGWTEIHDGGVTWSGDTLAAAVETQYRTDNDTTALATWTANGAVWAIASEIKIAPAGGGGSALPKIIQQH